jgi:hypothetical protein
MVITIVRSVILFVAMASILSVSGCHLGAGRSSDPDSGQASLVDAVLIQNATLALMGQDTVVTQILVERTDQSWRIAELARESGAAPSDTIDASGLFIHSASPFERMNPSGVGTAAILVARTGPSVGDPAVALIGATGAELWKPVSLADNRPPEPRDPVVGCYRIELGSWDNPTYAEAQPPEFVPTTLQLHWQHAWHLGGREKTLVATDGAGHIPGPATTTYYWGRAASDTVWITFGALHQGARFHLTEEGADLAGTVLRHGDTLPGPTATAQVRLRRYSC